MTELFLKAENTGISASWLILAVLLLRFVLKKSPKWVNVLLWGIVAIRLLSPFSIESALSLIPSTQTISPSIMTDPTPSIYTGVPALNYAINPVIGNSFAPNPGDSANPLQIWIPVLSILWAVGAFVLLLYAAASYFHLRRRVAEAVILRDNIFRSENASSPFVLGLFRARIYLPYQIDEKDLPHVIAHEQAHIKRGDHWWKPLGFLLLALHWFNPLMWLSYILLCRDIELACDEKVIKHLDNEQRANYTQALVSCSIGHRTIAACPLAFGEVGIKSRIRSVMNYRKPGFWIIILSIISCAVISVCFLTDPKSDPDALPLVHSHAYAIEEVTYESGMTSFVITSRPNTPAYRITGTMELLSITTTSLEAGSLSTFEVRSLGTLEETELNKENFDDLFFKGGIWASHKKASSIRRNNASAWSLIDQQNALNTFSYLLQQKNGDVYLAYGYRDVSEENDPASDDSNIFWLVKLNRILTESIGTIATSGGMSVPVSVFPAGTPVADMKNSVEWLDIAPSPDETVPFTILSDGVEQYGWYSIYDAKTMKPLDFFRPSGLSPQSYLFQNAKYGHDYLVTLLTEDGHLLCFGARLPKSAPESNSSAETKSTETTEQQEETQKKETPVTYTIKIIHATLPIFEGPTYDSSYVGVIGSAGTYTIVEEKEDDEGNLWGSLKSGIGWINLNEARSDEFPPITAVFADEKYLSTVSYHEYIADYSEYMVKLLFSPTEPLRNIRFTSLQHDGATMVAAEKLYTLPELSPDKPLVMGVVFYGDMTTYGISFTDAAETERHFSVYLSGRNGALILDELT